MRQALADLLRRLLQGSRWDSEQVLWGVLIGAFLISLIHLLTMFLTRWGERRVTGKALLCSLLLHGVFAMSVVTVAPLPGVPGGSEKEDGENEHKVIIRGIAAETDREAREGKGDGDGTPVWDHIPAAKNEKPLPVVPMSPTNPTPQKVERLAESVKPAEVKVPELPTLSENRQPVPKPVVTESAPSRQTAETPQIETPKSDPVARAATPPATRPHEPIPIPAPTAELKRQSPAVVDKPPDSNAPSNSHAIDTLPLVPSPEAPRPLATAPALDESAGRKAVPAPIVSLPADPAVGRESTTPSARPAQAARILSMASPGRQLGGAGGWQASIDRVRSKSLEATGPAERPAATGDYQPLDTRAPSPDVQGATAEPLIVRRSTGVAPTYRLRKLSNRKENARQFGGNDQSEQAVEASLRWLAKVQSPNGSWNAKAFGAGKVEVDENGVNRGFAGRDADSGVTALTILAFLGAGYTHEEGQYADNIDRALRWLIAQQRSDGNLGASAGHFAMMYCHGMATYALAEAYGMQNDPTSNTMLKEPLIRAVRYILENQNPDGGWRYVKGQKSDISMFGWQLMGLKSAEIAGVNIPRDAKVRMVAFLKERSLGESSGLAGYREDTPPSASMTAEALFCKQMLGIRRDNASSREAAEYLLAHLPKLSVFNEYYWYYGTLAMYQFGGAGWQTWNGAVREILVSAQRTDGELAGSWDPTGPWAQYGGRVYSTALSTLCLEVYYRFLPLYQMGNSGTD